MTEKELINKVLTRMSDAQRRALLRRSITYMISRGLYIADYVGEDITYFGGESLTATIPSKEDMEE